jgi:RimJ/RimL family protein N-acetyltransferase
MTAPVEMGLVARDRTRTAGWMERRSSDWTSELPVLREAGVTLRELRDRDASSLLRLLSDEKVFRFLAPPPKTRQGLERFIAWTHRQRASGRFICFGVVPDGERAAVGMFQIWRVGSTFETAEMGFVFGAPFWGTGLFMESAPAFLTFAFDTLNVRRLEGRAAALNGRGNGALRKLGAVPELVLRKCFECGEHRQDHIMWSILNEDWQKQAQRPWSRGTGTERR